MSERQSIVAFIRKYAMACRNDKRDVAERTATMLADGIERGLHLEPQAPTLTLDRP